MSKRCVGCGVILQDKDEGMDGYVDDINSDVKLCKRCFRIINYGEYIISNKDSEDFINIIKDINKTDSLVLYLVDLFTISDNINMINKYLDNKTILVMTKRDILPKSFNNTKLKNYVNSININKNIVDTIIISSIKNYNLDTLMNMIKKYKTDENVYVVGATNSGKSTLINKILKNYTDYEPVVTASILPSTTLDVMKIKLSDDTNIIDTPGLIDNSSIVNYLNGKEIKHITPKNEIKPRTFQLNTGKSILMDDMVRLDYIDGKKNSFTVYVSNNVKVESMNIATRSDNYKDYYVHEFNLDNNNDIVINGYGYIKVINKAQVKIYIKYPSKVYVRKSMI